MEGGHCQRRGDPRIEVLGQDYLSNAGGMSGGGAGGRKSIKDVAEGVLPAEEAELVGEVEEGDLEVEILMAGVEGTEQDLGFHLMVEMIPRGGCCPFNRLIFHF